MASAGTATLETGADRCGPSIGIPASPASFVVTIPFVSGEGLSVESTGATVMLGVLLAEVKTALDEDLACPSAVFSSPPASAILEDVGMVEVVVAAVNTVTHSISQSSSRSRGAAHVAAVNKRTRDRKFFILLTGRIERLKVSK